MVKAWELPGSTQFPDSVLTFDGDLKPGYGWASGENHHQFTS